MKYFIRFTLSDTMLPFDRERERKVSGRAARTMSVVIVMLLITSSLLFLASGTAKGASTIEVDSDQAPGWYDATHVHTITQALSVANNGDTILVWGGVYDEAVTVGKIVSIIGAPSDPVAKLVQNKWL